MTINNVQFNQLLTDFAERLDIPPSRYQQAVDRYEAVARWLEVPYPGCSALPLIYVQGSFRLGTVVRPFRGGQEVDYDIDLVCQLALLKILTDPATVKEFVGDRLKAKDQYATMLDDEGKRCWTLIYSDTDGPGFHLDVLPSVPDPGHGSDLAIAITDKNGKDYDWSASNPRGYGDWFDERNAGAFDRVAAIQRQRILTRAPDVYAQIEDVPDQLIRTPLQQSVQIMKRHRDVAFDQDASFAPISIIVTTLAAHLYRGENDLYSALTGIIQRLQAHAVLLTEGSINRALVGEPLITRTADGKWYLPNPVNPAENFADRWHEDNHAWAKAFFSWVAKLHEDLITLPLAPSPSAMIRRLPIALGVSSISGLSALNTAARKPKGPPRIEIPRGPKSWGDV